MRKLLLSLVVPGFLACAVGAASSGCATSSAAATPSGPIELNGTKWKLAMINGRLDGRIVEFKKIGDGYSGRLIKKARWMEDLAGLPENMEAFRLKSTGTANEYSGVYAAYGGDGNYSESVVNLSVTPDQLNWNLDSAIWERVKE